MSKTEDRIAQLLKEENIPFVREKTYEDLRGNRYRFDFFLPNENILIEYDSEIHFYFMKAFHKDRKDFLSAQERDRRKNSYCLANSIPLYRIPFTKFNNINCVKDFFKEEFLVKNRFHNDNLNIPKK